MRCLQSRGNEAVVILLILLAYVFSGCKGQPEIKDLKGPDWKKYVGKSVTVEAIFVCDPVPMLVTDLNIVLANTPMPPDQYIILTGKEAESIDPKKHGGARLSLSGIVKAVEDTIRYSRENVTIGGVTFESKERWLKYEPEIYYFDPFEFRPRAHRYAVLFSGGFNTASNHRRYWNDLKFMYSTLINKYGYTDKTIYVLYADGAGVDTQMTVDYSATQANLTKVFGGLRKKTTSRDFIFMFTTNHGGGFMANDLTISDLCGGHLDVDSDEGEEPLYENIYSKDINGDGDQTDQFAWDEVLYSWGGDILDDDFPGIFKKLKYNKMVIVMEQCFSGGLIFDMAQPCENRIIISAAGQYEFSWAMPPSYDYDEFSYWFTCAINQATADGDTVLSDTNFDGKVSMVEAFNYARVKDTAPETPWYEDNGDGVPHSGEMPALGEGKLGANTFLD